MSSFSRICGFGEFYPPLLFLLLASQLTTRPQLRTPQMGRIPMPEARQAPPPRNGMGDDRAGDRGHEQAVLPTVVTSGVVLFPMTCTSLFSLLLFFSFCVISSFYSFFSFAGTGTNVMMMKCLLLGICVLGAGGWGRKVMA